MNGGLPSPQPLVLTVDDSEVGFGFKMPHDDKVLNFYHGEAVRLVCAGQGNHFHGRAPLKDIVVTCDRDKKFSYEGRKMDFAAFKCRRLAESSFRHRGTKCLQGYYQLDIGFEASHSFIKIMEICFDVDNLRTFWSKYDLVSAINGSQTNANSDVRFREDFFPGISANTLYTKDEQRRTFAQILSGGAFYGGREVIRKSQRLAEQLVPVGSGGSRFLAKGHLSARADFLYQTQQAATFHLVNAAPQWQAFNNGNWRAVEKNVRGYASRYGNLQVYTGTHGVMAYRNVHGDPTSLYLDVDENNNYRVPVPALFWKIVYNGQTRKGVAIVGVNNPYVSRQELDGYSYKVCTDVCRTGVLSWVTDGFDASNTGKGVVYCCEVRDFHSKVSSSPKLSVNGLLGRAVPGNNHDELKKK